MAPNGKQCPKRFECRLPCQPNDQAGHKSIPRPHRILDDHFRCRGSHKVASIPQRRTRCDPW